MNKSIRNAFGNNGMDIMLLCLLFVFPLASCAKKQLVKNNVEQNSVATAAKNGMDGVESEELDIHGKDFQSSQNLKTIHFDFNSDNLSGQDRDVLFSNAGYLKENKNIEVLIEGHCDQRGTVAYNLALGQRRAAAVRKYYISLGVEPKRMGTISYGKEKPACIQNSEDCWSQNRRAESKIRTLKVASDKNSSKVVVK